MNGFSQCTFLGRVGGEVGPMANVMLFSLQLAVPVFIAQSSYVEEGGGRWHVQKALDLFPSFK